MEHEYRNRARRSVLHRPRRSRKRRNPVRDVLRHDAQVRRLDASHLAPAFGRDVQPRREFLQRDGGDEYEFQSGGRRGHQFGRLGKNHQKFGIPVHPNEEFIRRNGGHRLRIFELHFDFRTEKNGFNFLASCGNLMPGSHVTNRGALKRQSFVLRRRRALLEPDVWRFLHVYGRPSGMSLHGSVRRSRIRRNRDPLNYDERIVPVGRWKRGRFRRRNRESPTVSLLERYLRKIIRNRPIYEPIQIPRHLGDRLLRNALSVLGRIFRVRHELSGERCERLGSFGVRMEQDFPRAASARQRLVEFFVRKRKRGNWDAYSGKQARRRRRRRGRRTGPRERRGGKRSRHVPYFEYEMRADVQRADLAKH